MLAEGAGHVILCGLSGAGKSTVGPLLAAALEREAIDVDATIEAEAGRSVRDIFAHDGEAAFRERERVAVGRAFAHPRPAVISLGGGALENDATLGEALAHTLVWLDAPVTILAPRLSGSDRPLLAGDAAARLAQLADTRAPRYRRAHLIVDATRPPQAVVDAIRAGVERRAAERLAS